MRLPLLASSLALAIAAVASTLTAQEAHFADPVMMKAGEAPLGGTMLYPSPRVIDMNGDGHLDVVMGDLFGAVRWAPGAGAGATTLGEEGALKAQDGKELKFSNW